MKGEGDNLAGENNIIEQCAIVQQYNRQYNIHKSPHYNICIIYQKPKTLIVWVGET